MAATPDPIDARALNPRLNPVIAQGSGAKLLGWLEYLAHPEDHAGPRRQYVGGEGTAIIEMRMKNDQWEDAGSLLGDLRIEQFFYHADVLSGQDTHAIQLAVDAIEEARHRKDGTNGPREDTADMYTRLHMHLTNLFPNWTTTEGENAFNAFVDMHIWYQRRTEDIFKMSKTLVEFAAVITTARHNLMKLMDELVSALSDWVDGTGFTEAALNVIGKIAGFGLGKVDPTGTTGLLFDVLFGEVTKQVEDSTDDKRIKIPDEYGCYDKLKAFIKAADEICEKAADTVDAIIQKHDKNKYGGHTWDKDLLHLRDGMPRAPQLY